MAPEAGEWILAAILIIVFSFVKYKIKEVPTSEHGVAWAAVGRGSWDGPQKHTYSQLMVSGFEKWNQTTYHGRGFSSNALACSTSNATIWSVFCELWSDSPPWLRLCSSTSGIMERNERKGWIDKSVAIYLGIDKGPGEKYIVCLVLTTPVKWLTLEASK